MKNILIVAFTLVTATSAYAQQTNLKVVVNCGALARPSIVNVQSLSINNDSLRNSGPFSRIGEGGFTLKVIGSKLSLFNLQDESSLALGTVEQETECNDENTEVFSVTPSSSLDVNIETGPSQCLTREIDSKVEHFWLATRTFKFSDRATHQEAAFSTPVRPNDDPNLCK